MLDRETVVRAADDAGITIVSEEATHAGKAGQS
jgi:hypothetical protein